MTIASFHTNDLANTSSSIVNSHDGQCDAVKYTDQQIGEMPSWITAKKENFLPKEQTFSINTESFSDEQRLAYEIVTTHSVQEKPLQLIVNGEAGTGKSYLIYALCSHLKDKCKVTATTGKAAYAINGITIHSFLRLPVTHMLQKDLSGQALITIQERPAWVDYGLINLRSFKYNLRRQEYVFSHTPGSHVKPTTASLTFIHTITITASQIIQYIAVQNMNLLRIETKSENV